MGTSDFMYKNLPLGNGEKKEISRTIRMHFGGLYLPGTEKGFQGYQNRGRRKFHLQGSLKTPSENPTSLAGCQTKTPSAQRRPGGKGIQT